MEGERERNQYNGGSLDFSPTQICCRSGLVAGGKSVVDAWRDVLGGSSSILGGCLGMVVVAQTQVAGGSH